MDFVREPRLPVPPMAHGRVAVEAPPQVPAPTPVNPLARLLPVAMLVAAVGMMAVYFTSGAPAMRNPMYMFFPVMMLTSVLGTVIYSARGSNRTADINRDRQNYLRYLDTLDQATACSIDEHRRALQWCHPEPGSLWTLAGGADGCGSDGPKIRTIVSSGSASATSHVHGVDHHRTWAASMNSTRSL